MKTEKQLLALFDTGYGCHCSAENNMEGHHGWTRISEYTEFEFVLLPDQDVILNQIQTIDNDIKTVMEDAMKAVDKLKQKKADLMALTHEV